MTKEQVKGVEFYQPGQPFLSRASFGLGWTTPFLGGNNVIEIEGLLFPGFGQTQAHKFPSSDVMSALKCFQLNSSILSAFMTSLDGKTQFSMERLHFPKPRE